MSYDLAAGTAAMHVRNDEVVDQYNVVNALMGGDSVPATVSHSTFWFDPAGSETLDDAEKGFRTVLVETDAATTFTASIEGFSFVGDPAHTSVNAFARLGFETNGVYYGEAMPDVEAEGTPMS